MNLDLLSKLVLAAFITFGLSQAARAEDTPTPKSSIGKKDQLKDQKPEKKQEKKPEKKLEKKLEKKQELKQQKKKEQPRFIDRNGDGIQDGREHRFRGKHRRRGKKGLDQGDDGERRHRARGESSGRP